MTETPLPDYAGLRSAIAPLAVSASELHGGLCGFLCAGGKPQPRHWLDQIRIDADGLDNAAWQELERLRTATIGLIDDPELRFTPLVPDEEAGMAERVTALSDWCGGFLGGFGLAAPGGIEHWSEDARDALRDLEKISHFGYEAGDSEEDETALTEILEFVRVAALLLRQETGHTGTPPGVTRH